MNHESRAALYSLNQLAREIKEASKQLVDPNRLTPPVYKDYLRRLAYAYRRAIDLGYYPSVAPYTFTVTFSVLWPELPPEEDIQVKRHYAGGGVEDVTSQPEGRVMKERLAKLNAERLANAFYRPPRRRFFGNGLPPLERQWLMDTKAEVVICEDGEVLIDVHDAHKTRVREKLHNPEAKHES